MTKDIHRMIFFFHLKVAVDRDKLIVTFKFVVKEPSVRLSRPNKFWKAKDELFRFRRAVCVVLLSVVVYSVTEKSLSSEKPI